MCPQPTVVPVELKLSGSVSLEVAAKIAAYAAQAQLSPTARAAWELKLLEIIESHIHNPSFRLKMGSEADPALREVLGGKV